LFAIRTNVASLGWMYMYDVHFIWLTTVVAASHKLSPPNVHNKCSTTKIGRRLKMGLNRYDRSTLTDYNAYPIICANSLESDHIKLIQ
jgi:hypothetical protein